MAHVRIAVYDIDFHCVVLLSTIVRICPRETVQFRPSLYRNHTCKAVHHFRGPGVLQYRKASKIYQCDKLGLKSWKDYLIYCRNEAYKRLVALQQITYNFMYRTDLQSDGVGNFVINGKSLSYW